MPTNKKEMGLNRHKRTNQIMRYILLLPAFLLLFTQCKKKEDTTTYPYQFLFLTEQYKPLNYTDNGTVTGLAPEVLKEVCSRLNIPFEVSVLPWDQAYSKVLQTGNAVLFSTILNTERKDKFKWAGPIASLDWHFYSSSQNPVTLTSLDDAKQVGHIGVLPDYSITQYLVGQGFTNLVYCSDNVDAFDRLLKGEIDLFPSDRITAEAALDALHKSYYSATPRLTIRTDLVYFAFNKGIPDQVVADFQREIDAIKDNGLLTKLYRQFMKSSDVPGTLQIYTENYPPLTFIDPYGGVTGFGSDMVNEIMHRNKFFGNIKLSLWSIGYDLALENPNFCLFTMDRTAQRDSLFQWVGPLGTNTTYFYTKAGSGVTIASLDDAKNLPAVGTVSSWFNDQYLRNLGFTNLVSDGDPRVMAQKLMQGQVQAFVCSGVTFPDILREIGYAYSQVVPAFALMSTDYYIAFSKGTPYSMVSQWQSALDAAKLDGTYDAIYHKWFP